METPPDRNPTESEIIASAIHFLEHAKYSERAKYLREIRDNGSTVLDGFEIRPERLCWVVWKTDKNLYGSQALFKIIPKTTSTPEQMITVLNVQNWCSR